MLVYLLIKGALINMTTIKQKNMISNIDTILLAQAVSQIYKCSIEEANTAVRNALLANKQQPAYKVVDCVAAYTKVNKKVATI